MKQRENGRLHNRNYDKRSDYWLTRGQENRNLIKIATSENEASDAHKNVTGH